MSNLTGWTGLLPLRLFALTLAAWVGLLQPPLGTQALSAPQRAGDAGPDAAGARYAARQADSYRRQAEDIRREIEIHEKRLDEVARRENDVLAELDGADRKIQRARRKARALDAEALELDRQLASAAEASADLKDRIKANEGYLGKRLVAWYKLNRIGRIHLLASAENVASFMRRKSALERILAYDERIRRKLLDSQDELQRLRNILEKKRREKRRRIEEKQQQLELLARNRKIRSRLLAEVRQDKDLQSAALESLKRAADQLDRKFASIGHRHRPPDSSGGELSKPFTDYKGLLKMPVEGNIVNLFGPYRNAEFNVTNFRSGIDIKTDKGEPVRAVHSGEILYASWFKGYGNMMIIDHGANYYTVYAHVEEMFKTTGDRVRSGEVIATAGDTGSMGGARLYFEIRHHGKPVDPVQWLK